MCPLHQESDEYKPVKVDNIIATFEQLAVRSNQLVRSESSVSRRVQNKQSFYVKPRRDIKSEVIVKNNTVTLVAKDFENGDFGNTAQSKSEVILNNEAICSGSESIGKVVSNSELVLRTRSSADDDYKSEERIRRLESIEEAESADLDNLAKTKAKAKAILKKYEDEVLHDNKDDTSEPARKQSIYLTEYDIDYCAILDDECEGFRSRNNSISVEEDEYVNLRDAKKVNQTNPKHESEYCVLRQRYDKDGNYIPTYENIATLRKIVEDGKLAEQEKIHARTGSTYRQELINNNSTRRHSTQKKKYLIDELIQTEVRYIKDLEFVIENYMEYISTHHKGDPMSRYKFIFINIEMITIESKMLLSDIKCNEDNYENIGKIFCRYKNLIDRYTVYCKNKRVSEKLINGDYAKIIEKRRRDIRDALGLHSYLLKPIQRLLRYEMFLRKLDKYLKLDGADTSSVKMAIHLIQKAARRGNDLIIINCIEEMPHCLLDTGDFVMADSFKMLVPKKMDIELFLFQRMIVFAVKKDQESFLYKTYIPLENLSKTSDQQKTTIMFEDYYMKKKHKDPSFILDAMTMEKKIKWVEYIENILWQQLHKIREHVRASNYIT